MKFIFIILLTFSTVCYSQKSKSDDQTHQLFNNLLQKYVTSYGSVNYLALKQDEKSLDRYLNELSKNIPDNSSSRNVSLAYWINAYNAFTLKLILDNYPLKSITDLNNGKPWDVKWITLGNKKYSLNNIENDIIRPVYKDARIHFALNCAAISCPPLLNKAFTSNNIEELMDTQTRNFINSQANDLGSTKIKVSKVFDWYKKDFGDVTAFISKYSKTKINSNALISYKEYNWSLNKSN
jgi:hypothetical protein